MRLISWNVNGRYRTKLPKQIAALCARQPDVVALQEVRTESLSRWQAGFRDAGLPHVLDSATLLRVPGPPGRDYRRRYFNLIAARWDLRELPGLALAFPERYLAARVSSNDLEFEVHNAHVPPGSTRGLVKVDMFKSLAERLGEAGQRPRILCGDFNTPRLEGTDGTVEFWGDKRPRYREDWNEAERSVILGLADKGLPDLFRTLHGYPPRDASWYHRRGDRQVGRRYDHIFASPRLGGTACHYLHDWREAGLSDHSAIEADFGPQPRSE